MKKIVSSIAPITIATTSMVSISAFAKENTDTEREFERPAFCQDMENFKDGFRFNAESGKKIPAMKKEGKFQNFGDFKPAKKAFDGKSIADIKEKLADLTEEEKAEIKEKFAEKKSFSGKPGIFRKAGRKINFGKRTAE